MSREILVPNWSQLLKIYFCMKVQIIPPLSFGWYQSTPSKPRRGSPWLHPRPPSRAGPCPPWSAALSQRPWEKRAGALGSWRIEQCGGGRWGGRPRTGLPAPLQRRLLPPQCSWSERFWGEISLVLVTHLVTVVQLRLKRRLASGVLSNIDHQTKNPNIDQISTTQHFIDQISTAKFP
mgnify:CR=1 FL=1